jgi:hypothetical protein
MPRPVAAVLALGLIFGLAIGIAYTQAPAPAPPPDWNKGTTDEKIKKLSDLQPGLGTVMMEYSARFTNAYYAAKGGNFDLAQYMFKEMREIQEVGENTRPARAPLLKAFETNYLDKLDAAAKAKDWSKYSALFPQVVRACNTCHVKVDFAFIQYQLPSAPPAPLKMTKP